MCSEVMGNNHFTTSITEQQIDHGHTIICFSLLVKISTFILLMVRIKLRLSWVAHKVYITMS